MAVRLAMTATTMVGLPKAGMSWSPATGILWLRLGPIAPAGRQDVVDTRVSQIRVGGRAWNWYPGASAVELPYQPLASITTLMTPSALYTQIASFGPPDVPGPRATMARFAWTAPAFRLIVENLGALVPTRYGHRPFTGGNSVSAV